MLRTLIGDALTLFAAVAFVAAVILLAQGLAS